MLREVGNVGCYFQAIEEMVDHMTTSYYGFLLSPFVFRINVIPLQSF